MYVIYNLFFKGTDKSLLWNMFTVVAPKKKKRVPVTHQNSGEYFRSVYSSLLSSRK